MHLAPFLDYDGAARSSKLARGASARWLNDKAAGPYQSLDGEDGGAERAQPLILVTWPPTTVTNMEADLDATVFDLKEENDTLQEVKELRRSVETLLEKDKDQATLSDALPPGATVVRSRLAGWSVALRRPRIWPEGPQRVCLQGGVLPRH